MVDHIEVMIAAVIVSVLAHDGFRGGRIGRFVSAHPTGEDARRSPSSS